MESVGCRRARQTCLVVRRFDVIEQLVFRAGGVDPVVVRRAGVVGVLDAAVEDAAVAALANLPFELELEIAVLVLRDDVGYTIVLDERAGFDSPTGRHRLTLVAAPRVERLAVEERPPRAISDCGWRISDCGLEHCGSQHGGLTDSSDDCGDN